MALPNDKLNRARFMRLQVVRFFDRECNVLVYVAESDRVIGGSLENSISTAPNMGVAGTIHSNCPAWMPACTGMVGLLL